MISPNLERIFNGFKRQFIPLLCNAQEMAKKFSNLLLTPDSYALTERLSQQTLNSYGCRILFKFDTGVNYVQSQIGIV
ncbi:MAG: hypothetical protein ACKO9I_02630 [Sphaerospermopsis kisseleviana]